MWPWCQDNQTKCSKLYDLLNEQEEPEEAKLGIEEVAVQNQHRNALQELHPWLA